MKHFTLTAMKSGKYAEAMIKRSFVIILGNKSNAPDFKKFIGRMLNHNATTL